VSTFSERLRDRAKYDTAMDPYKLLVEAADRVEPLAAALGEARKVVLTYAPGHLRSDYLRRIDAALSPSGNGEGTP
jgi:hypothetical protein